MVRVAGWLCGTQAFVSRLVLAMGQVHRQENQYINVYGWTGW